MEGKIMNEHNGESNMPPQAGYSTVAHNEYGARFVKRTYLILMFWAAYIVLSAALIFWGTGRITGLGALIFLYFLVDRAEKLVKGRIVSVLTVRRWLYFSSAAIIMPLILFVFYHGASNFKFFLVFYFFGFFPWLVLGAWSIFTLWKFRDAQMIQLELLGRKRMHDSYTEWLYR
jgi:hypothetical protein